MRYFLIFGAPKCAKIVIDADRMIGVMKIKERPMKNLCFTEKRNCRDTSAEQSAFFRLASRSCVLVGKRKAYYALWVSVLPPFDCAVEVRFGRDMIRRRLPSSFADGYRFYRLIARNGVTPCTLDDIICDFYENVRG